MSSNKKIIVILIALLGFGNLFVGAWSFITINSLNLPTQISTLTSQLDSLDTSLVQTPALQEQITNLKQSSIEELNNFKDYSEMLNTIPIYFIFIGTLFVAIALISYFIIPNSKKSKNSPKI